MNNKTDSTTNNHKIKGQFESWISKQMPQLHQGNKLNTKQENLKQNQPQFEFVNLKALSVNAFLRLQQMENPAYSIVFVNHITSKPKHIKLKFDGVTKEIPLEKIIRLEACSNYTQFYFRDSIKPVLTSKTLKFYTEQLDKNTFVRPHKSHFVNRNFIKQIVLKPEPHLILKEGKKICISRRRIGVFRNWNI